MGPSFFKQSRTATKIAKHRQRQARVAAENDKKKGARQRDKKCRTPLCGCRKFGVSLKARQEVSHDRHKGMGGNPTGDRSDTRLLIYLCLHRHQDGIFSRHKGTLRNRYLDAELCNDGPVAWDVKIETLLEHFGEDLIPGGIQSWDMAVSPDGLWIEMAREVKVQQLLELMPWQRFFWEKLAGMEL